jgi:hypothetical protein
MLLCLVCVVCRYSPYAYFRAGQQSLAHDGDDLAAFLGQADQEKEE